MKKSKKKKKIKIFFLIAILIFIVISLYFSYKKIFSKEIYSYENRSTNIKNEQKKDRNIYYHTMGWLRVQGTNIDTPIITYNYEMLEKDNKKIPEIEIGRDKPNYLWNNVENEKIYNKVTIMGHNLLNLSSKPDVGLKYFSRFDDLMAFVYYDFIKGNKYIEYTINGQDYMYKIYSVSFDYHDNIDLYTVQNYTKKQMKEYIKETKKQSIYKFNLDVNENDKIISLVTCTRLFGSDDQKEFIINARMVRKNEKLTNYKVTKTKNYNKIEKILKGDVEDEKA